MELILPLVSRTASAPSRDQHDQHTPDRNFAATDEVAVAPQRQIRPAASHCAAFALSDLFPTALHWFVFRAPVAQGIERSPAEAEVACSNHAGRTFAWPTNT